MNTRIRTKGDWHIVLIDSPHISENEIERYFKIIDDLLGAGIHKIALQMNPKTSSYLKFLSLLIKCRMSAEKRSVKLVVIQTNQDFLKTIHEVNLDKAFTFITSEDDLIK